MNLQYRKLVMADITSFIQMRINQLEEEGAEPVVDLKPDLLRYYTNHLNDGTFVSWLALDGERIVGTGGISFVEKPPYYSCPSGKIGLLSSMYTLKEYRRKGIARTVLEKIMQKAKEYGCGSIQITASDMGMLLYTELGFKGNSHFMHYTL